MVWIFSSFNSDPGTLNLKFNLDNLLIQKVRRDKYRWIQGTVWHAYWRSQYKDKSWLLLENTHFNKMDSNNAVPGLPSRVDWLANNLLANKFSLLLTFHPCWKAIWKPKRQPNGSFQWSNGFYLPLHSLSFDWVRYDHQLQRLVWLEPPGNCFSQLLC